MVREQTRAQTELEKDLLHQIQISNRLGLADRKTAVFFITSGSGYFNCDLRRTYGLQQFIPEALLDPKVEKFKALHQHFGLLSTGKVKPRYMDFIEPGVGVNLLTVKPQNGPSAFHRPTQFMNGLDSTDYTKEQNQMFFAKSEANDICTNMVDYITLRNDVQEPVSNYVVMMEGSPQFLSNIAQIGTPVPNWFSRVNYGPQGRPFTFPPGHDKAGQLEYVDIGSFKRMPPLREDNKMFVFNIYHDLEVDDAITNPINVVKYPVENGDLTQELITISFSLFIFQL